MMLLSISVILGALIVRAPLIRIQMDLAGMRRDVQELNAFFNRKYPH